MKILPDNIEIKNPLVGVAVVGHSYEHGLYQGWEDCQLSILNQCVEVDLDRAWLLYSEYLRRPNRVPSEDVTFEQYIQVHKSQFIQSEIEKEATNENS